MKLRNWELACTFDGPRGTYLQILPVLNLFYPTKNYGGDRQVTVTIHVGWIAWVFIAHFCWNVRRKDEFEQTRRQYLKTMHDYEPFTTQDDV